LRLFQTPQTSGLHDSQTHKTFGKLPHCQHDVVVVGVENESLIKPS
jgi:hypothetical protein